MLGNKPRFQAAEKEAVHDLFYIFSCVLLSHGVQAEVCWKRLDGWNRRSRRNACSLAAGEQFEFQRANCRSLTWLCLQRKSAWDQLSSAPRHFFISTLPVDFPEIYFPPPCKEYLTRSKHRFPLEKVIKIDIPRIPNPSRHFFLSSFENRRKKSTHVFFSHFYLFRFFLSSFLFARFPLPREVRSGDFS